MITRQNIRKLPRTQNSSLNVPKKRRLTYNDPFKIYDYHNEMEFVGIDIYITDAGYTVGRVRYTNNKLYSYKITNKKARPEDSDWKQMRANVNNYVVKSKKQRNAQPIKEVDQTKISLINKINEEIGEEFGIDKIGLEKSNRLLNEFVKEVIKHEAPEIC